MGKYIPLLSQEKQLRTFIKLAKENDVPLQIHSRNDDGEYLFCSVVQICYVSFLGNKKSAAKEVLRILKDEDPNASLKIYWHYWSGSVPEMLNVLRFYQERVIFGFGLVIILFPSCVMGCKFYDFSLPSMRKDQNSSSAFSCCQMASHLLRLIALLLWISLEVGLWSGYWLFIDG